MGQRFFLQYLVHYPRRRLIFDEFYYQRYEYHIADSVKKMPNLSLQLIITHPPQRGDINEIARFYRFADCCFCFRRS